MPTVALLRPPQTTARRDRFSQAESGRKSMSFPLALGAMKRAGRTSRCSPYWHALDCRMIDRSRTSPSGRGWFAVFETIGRRSPLSGCL